MVFDTAVNGVADPNDPTRRRDILSLGVLATALPSGAGRLCCEGIPRYSEMIHQVAARLGWNPNDFRGFRCEITYPVYGSQVCMLFQPPQKP